MPDFVLIAVRFVHYASAASLAGALLFHWSIASPALRRGGANWAPTTLALRNRLLAICWGSLAVAVASAALWLMLLSASITGAPFGRALSDGTAATVLTRTRFGHNWLVRSALALLLAAALVSLGRGRNAREAAAVRRGDLEPLSNASATMLALCFVGTLAWAGHCGAIPGVAGGAQVAADFLHLSAAAAWFGALLPLSMFLAAAADTRESAWIDIARDAVARFSTLGTLAVATLVATGAANAWALVGSAHGLIDTHYGRLLLLKEALFASMLALAAVNRFWLAPRLAASSAGSLSGLSDHASADRSSMRRLQRNSLLEALLGSAILAAVAVLGTMTPAAVMH